MKLKIKKFIYLINDFTNLLLKKEGTQSEKSVKKWQIILIIVSIILILSIFLNFYLYFKLK